VVHGDLAQGSFSSLAAFALRCGIGGAAHANSRNLAGGAEKPTPMEKPQGRRAGPSLRLKVAQETFERLLE
jgi:hypothetical protein